MLQLSQSLRFSSLAGRQLHHDGPIGEFRLFGQKHPRERTASEFPADPKAKHFVTHVGHLQKRAVTATRTAARSEQWSPRNRIVGSIGL